MFFFVKKNTYEKDGITKCFVTLYDSRSDDVISCGPVNGLSGGDLDAMVSGLTFASPVDVELAFSSFNGQVRPQICNLKEVKK